MLQAVIDGGTEPQFLASLAVGNLRKKVVELEKFLNGLIKHHQRMLLSIQLKHIDFLDKHIENISNEIDVRLKEEQEIVELIDELPGIGKRSAVYIISEIGTNMIRIPTANHLCSWAGLCPGNNESEGKKKSTKTREGNKSLRGTLVACARACVRCKDTYFYSQYNRIAARRGKNVLQ